MALDRSRRIQNDFQVWKLRRLNQRLNMSLIEMAKSGKQFKGNTDAPLSWRLMPKF